MTTKIYGPYSPRPRVPALTGGASKTKQSFKKDCDINHIMAKYQKTGVITHLAENKAQYGFASSNDFRTSVQLVKDAEELFAGLPSKLRRKFNESPSDFLAFCEDPDNRSEAALLGLLNEEATAEEAALLAATDSASAPVPPSPATTDAD